jgi:hypothetical protein
VSGPGILLALLMFLLPYSLEKDSTDFYFLALVSGLFLDAYSGLYFGSFTFSFLILGFLLNLLSRQIFRIEINRKYLVLLVVAAVFWTNAFLWAYNLLMVNLGLAKQYVIISPFGARTFAEAGYTVVLFYPVYKFAEWVRGFVDRFSLKQQNLK